ncbi:MAG: MATE family efflux transporter [Planctomycetaceae bacterium]
MSPKSDQPTELPEARDAAPGSMLELLRVAVPLVLSAGSLSLMSAVDRILLTGYSADALAAVTPGSMLHWTVVCIPMGTILYANTFISQFDGAGLPNRMASSLWQAIWLAIVCGLLMVALLPCSRMVFEVSGQPSAVISEGSVYFNTLCAGSSILLLSIALSCYFSGRRRTSVVMYVNMLGVVVNFVLDYLLIYGVGPFPELGIRGAAIATLIARCGDIIIYCFLIHRSVRRTNFPLLAHWRPNFELLAKYFRYGFPSGLHYFVDNSGFTIFLLMIGNLGRDALASTNLAFSVNGLIFVPLLGFGTAIQTIVGHHLGAGLPDAASKTTWNAVKLGIGWTGVTSLLLLTIPEVALMPFSAFAQERPAAAAALDELTPSVILLLRFVAFYSVFDALAVIFSSALRGAGDTVYPMLLTMGSSWLIMVVPAWYLSRQPTTTLPLLWWTCALHISFAGTAMFVRFQTGRWKRIHLVDCAAPESGSTATSD